jgi:hypothetical protein
MARFPNKLMLTAFVAIGALAAPTAAGKSAAESVAVGLRIPHR